MDKTNNDVKQEHYVPKSYLAWFADDHGKINVYDYKKMEYRKKQSIEKIAKIGGFYDFDENNLEYMKKFKEDIDKQYIEKMFSHNIEPALKDIIEKLSNLDIGFLDSCPSIKNHTLKLNISYLLVFQFLRTRSYRDFFENLLDDSKAAAFEQKKMLLDQESIDNLANYICNMSWTFCFNMSKVPYITSDNPVVIADYDFNYGHTALISKKKKNIQYPLSPQILLQIFDDGCTGERTSDIMDVIICDENNPEFVNYPNSQQMENAYQFVFSYGDFNEKYFEDKKAGYVDLPTSSESIKYQKDMDELMEQVPKMQKLLRKLDDPEITFEDAIKISQEYIEIYRKVIQIGVRPQCGQLKPRTLRFQYFWAYKYWSLTL